MEKNGQVTLLFLSPACPQLPQLQGVWHLGIPIMTVFIWPWYSTSTLISPIEINRIYFHNITGSNGIAATESLRSTWTVTIDIRCIRSDNINRVWSARNVWLIRKKFCYPILSYYYYLNNPHFWFFVYLVQNNTLVIPFHFFEKETQLELKFKSIIFLGFWELWFSELWRTLFLPILKGNIAEYSYSLWLYNTINVWFKVIASFFHTKEGVVIKSAEHRIGLTLNDAMATNTF